MTIKSAAALDALNRVIARVQAINVGPGRAAPACTKATAATAGGALDHKLTPPGDITWSPEIPHGHTSYTWTGVHAAPRRPAAPSQAPASEPQGEAAASVSADERAQFEQLEFRVGRIVDVRKHPDADSLYVEQIDLGEPSPREIVSGLVKFITEDRLRNSLCVVFANLKPNKLRGIMSNGMVMCASNADRTVVELISPPEGAVPGDIVTIAGANVPPAPPAQVNPKKKGNAWETSAPLFKTNAERVATFAGAPLQVIGKGCCTSPSLPAATIS
ncbi:tRNA-binding domain-containing protein [Plasmodiophora brassicae]